MKSKYISEHLYVFYAFVFGLYILTLFIESEKLKYIVGLFVIVMLIVSFCNASKLFKILSLSFLFIGSYLYIHTGQSLLALPPIMTSNVGLLMLLAMLPWMNSVVKSGGFDRDLNTLMQVKVSNLGELYTRSSATTLTLASFLNLSAATISQDVLKTNLAYLSKKDRGAFISTATLRGYSLALLWSPLEILLAMSIFITGVSYVSLLPWLLLIGFIMFYLDSLWGKIYFKNHIISHDELIPMKYIDLKKLFKKLIHLIISLAFFLMSVISIGTLFELDFILTVTLLIFPFAIIWSIIMKRLRRFWVIGWSHWKEKTNTMQNFIILFISLSLFSYGIGEAPFMENIQQPILKVAEYPLLVFVIIQMAFIVMSMFGVHPIATFGILGSLLSSLLTIYNPLSIAIVLVTSSVATLTVGTYGLVVTLTSMNIEQSPYRITLINLPYALLFGGIGTIIAYILL